MSDTPTLTLRDHSKPCEHDQAFMSGDKEWEKEWWDCRICPGGREIVFEKWNDWCWAHDREPHGPFNDACLMQGYRGDCDIRPMYRLLEVSDE